MNSIVERLRNPFHMHDSPTMREAADLIEQQAERIKELEAALCEEVEARSKWYCEADRLKEELAAALRAAIESAQKVEPVSDDRLLLQQVFSICEASEDECHGSDNPFNRGRAFEAKRIRNGIGNWYQDTFCGKSFMGEPVTAFAYAEYIESPDGVPDEERK